MTKLAVLITAYNREDFVGTCIRSIQAAISDNLEITFYVMNNGSTDNTEAEIRKCGEEINLFSTPENRNVIEVLNRGFEAVYDGPDADYILLLNEDTKFEEGALEKLLEIHERHPISFMSPLQRNYREPDRVDPSVLDLAMQNKKLVEDTLMNHPLEEVYELPLLIGASLLARKEAWVNVGIFDKLFWFYGCDNDYCERAAHLGYKLYLAPQSILYHAHGKLTRTSSIPDKKIQKWRYRTEMQSRFMMQLKKPQISLSKAYFIVAGMAASDFFKSIAAVWPRGVYNAVTIFIWCLFAAPRVYSSRKHDLDLSRSVQQP